MGKVDAPVRLDLLTGMVQEKIAEIDSSGYEFGMRLAPSRMERPTVPPVENDPPASPFDSVQGAFRIHSGGIDLTNFLPELFPPTDPGGRAHRLFPMRWTFASAL